MSELEQADTTQPMMPLGPSSTWSGTFSDQDGRAGNRLFSKHVNQAQIASRSERTTVRKQERREQRDGISFFHLIGEWTGGWRDHTQSSCRRGLGRRSELDVLRRGEESLRSLGLLGQLNLLADCGTQPLIVGVAKSKGEGEMMPRKARREAKTYH